MRAKSDIGRSAKCVSYGVMVRLFDAFSGRSLAQIAAPMALCIASSLGCASAEKYDVTGGDNNGSTGGQVSGTAGVASAQGGGAPLAGSSNSSAGAYASAGASSSAGSNFAGSTSGGSSGFAGSPGIAGSASGGTGGSGTAGSSTAGMMNTAGSGGSAQAGATGSAGSAGSGSGGTGCSAPVWASGMAYKAGDVLSGTCQVVGGGATVCMMNTKYAWACSGPTCSVFAPGAAGWWSNWTLGTVCP